MFLEVSKKRIGICIVFLTSPYRMAYGPDTEELMKRINNHTTWLFIGDLNIYTLPKLPDRITNLQCRHSPLSFLFELPSNLKVLNLKNSPLTFLPDLPDGLTYLDCCGSKLISLPNLPGSLELLDCSDTQLISLPKLPRSLKRLYCENTPLDLPMKKGEATEEYKLRRKEWRDERKSMKRIKKRNKILKEEIMMEAWKPERMERWSEVGYDPDE